MSSEPVRLVQPGRALTAIEPYPYQRRVADLLLDGQNVMLQAPTGGGKTLAALLPFIEAQERGHDFPRQCIYSVPMRVLANQFVASDLGLTHHATIQTGEHRHDDEFCNSLTFTTIDQVLSSFLMMPYSLSRGMANVNAGAIAASYLVFDEFHLYDPETMLPTTLEMLRILRDVAPFLLMTATFSRDMLLALADYLGAVVVPETPADAMALATLPSQQKTRRYHVAQRPLDAAAVLAVHQQRSLVICNTVERAQRLYLQLREHPCCHDEVLLLHARYLPADRAAIEERLRTLFGKEAPADARCIAVATQAIEVGLDITCEALHTELAPANAVLQRAGRCARYQGQEGDVYVYPTSGGAPEEIVDLQDKIAPYVSQRDQIVTTLSELQARDGHALTFHDEQDLISAVHGPKDQLTVQGITAARETRRRLMNACWRGEQRASSELVRSIASQKVIIHDDPLTVASRPFAYDSFELHIGVVRGLVKRWQARTEGEETWVWALHDITAEGAEHSLWDASPLVSDNDVAGALAVIVHPALARYDASLGFWPHEGGSYVAAARAPTSQERVQYGYHLEPWSEHACLVWQAHRAGWPWLQRAARRLETRAGWHQGVLDHLADLVALLHDVGKLNIAWQEWVRTYQQRIGRPVHADCYYAHSDSDPDDLAAAAASRATGPRPPHALEGAVSLAPALQHHVDNDPHLFKAAFSAIARHHGAFTRNLQGFALVASAPDLVRDAATDVGIGDMAEADDMLMKGNAAEWQQEVDDLLIDPSHNNELVAYMLLARALRLADRKGTSAGKPQG